MMSPVAQALPRQRVPFFSKENLHAAAVGLWFLGTFQLISLDPSPRHQAQIILIGWLFTWGISRFGLKFLIGPAFEQDALLKGTFILFVGWSLASSMVSNQGVYGVAMMIAFCAGFLSCAGAWRFIRFYSLNMLRAYAVLATSLAWFFWLTAPAGIIRFNYIVHPNHWGAICFVAAVSALAVRSWPIRIGIIAADIYIILQAESRTSFLCVATGLCTFTAVRIYQLRGRNRMQTGFFILLLMGAVVASLFYLDRIASVLDSVLFLHDKIRGTGSGFTGRTEFWKATWNLFLDHPVFGIGPRVVEQMQVKDLVMVGHNGYLVVLADYGLPGAMLAFTMIAIRTWRLWVLAKTGDRGATIGFSVVIGYLFLGIFEMRLLNVGDPISLMAWVFLLMPRGYLNLPMRVAQHTHRQPVRPRMPYYQPLPRRI